MELASGLNPDTPIDRDTATPLVGAELTWQEWLGVVVPNISIPLMAPEHLALWEWVDALTPGIRPDAFLGDWPRGFGKTTTARLAMARMAVTVRRKFGLYVCANQETANNHINTIRERFQKLGISRLEDKYGYSLGWNGERLRTANGFNLIALGLDQSKIRGLNLNDLRPDLIVLDDIDDLHDSVDMSQKHYEIITQTVIPAGSPDRAVLFVQNEIHGNSVMHRFVSGEADALRRRILSKCIAVNGFKCEKVPSAEPGKPDEYRITEGVSTWPGKSIAEWEADLNDIGEQPFRRECLHELGAGGLFFSFLPTIRDEASGEGRPWHICPAPTIRAHWDVWGSHDYGTGAAACSHIWVVDDWGGVIIVGEEYRADRTSKQQCLALQLKVWELGLGEKPPAHRDESVPGGIVATDEDGHEKPVKNRLDLIAFDYANTFLPEGPGAQTAQQRMGEYPIEVWNRYQMPVVRAVKDIIAGLRMFSEWLSRTITYPANHPTEPGRRVPAFRIAEGAAPMLQGYLEKAMKDPKDNRLAVAPARFEHAGDSGRYGLMTRPDPSRDPSTLRLSERQGMRDIVSGEMRPAIVQRVQTLASDLPDEFEPFG